ncbi:uncharacterized protein CCOS01_05296 [Colletotrichum costaricense]|uniref:Ankyrin repeat protein n=1 Tax=Colletotrichum costaricense TaxID=1209916 RepID=A0AAI9Z161_9PEZI|nr:uncharacterized protein CCOS01_05296 [Colletotrichum costaricense]KAK1530193.1 hypothetical protein CCOS01_05296 [Colletotrichum costaricense]
MLDDDKKSIAIRVGRYSPLLEIGANNTIDVFHKSIRDFLLQAAEERENFCLKSHRQAHRDLAVLCMKVIIHKDEWLRAQQRENRSLPSIRIYLGEHTFLLYSVRYWRQHLLEAIPPQTPRHKIDEEILSGVHGIVKMWKDDTPLEVLSALGLDAILQVFIELSQKTPAPRIRRPTERINDAVRLAIQGGHEGCFDILWDRDSLNELTRDRSIFKDHDYFGMSALYAVFAYNYGQTFRIVSLGLMTLLHWAVTRPSRRAHFPHEDGEEDITEDIMRSLLRGGADIRRENSRGISVLQWAGRERSQILQAIFSGLDGVQLIQIRHNANIDHSPLWQPLGDLETDSPGRLVPLANAPCTQIRQRDVEEVCETSEPQPARANLWIRIKRRLRLDQGKFKR